MVMFKRTQSQNMHIINGNKADVQFDVGFEYMVDGVLYKVKEVVKDGATQLRKVQTSDGRIEFVTVDTIRRDLLSKRDNPIILKEHEDGKK